MRGSAIERNAKLLLRRASVPIRSLAQGSRQRNVHLVFDLWHFHDRDRTWVEARNLQSLLAVAVGRMVLKF